MKNNITKIYDILKQSHTPVLHIYFLVFSNVVSIGFAVYYHWQLSEVIMLFWAQNIIIGIFSVCKLWFNKNIIFSGKEVVMVESLDKQNIQSKDQFYIEKSQKYSKKFFVFGFGFRFFIFNIFYLLFFQEFFNIGHALYLVLIPLGLFILNHTLSFLKNFKREYSEPIQYKQFTDTVFIRVLPIHIFLIIGIPLVVFSSIVIEIICSFTNCLNSSNESLVLTGAVVLFMLMKTFFDVVAHIVSHVNPVVLEQFRDSLKKEKIIKKDNPFN